MKLTPIKLWDREEYSYPQAGSFIPDIVPYLHQDGKIHPAMVVVPGGAYRFVCPIESEIIGDKFYEQGYNVFVLTYTTNYSLNAPLKLQPLKDLSRAVRLIRKRFKEFSIDCERVAVCGFSAGGHLAASLAVHHGISELTDLGEYSEISNYPNAVLLGYPVISAVCLPHEESIEALLGKNATTEELEWISLEKQVSSDTAPIFLWHTISDIEVAVDHSILMAQALREQGIFHELHLYSSGPHGMSTADEKWASGDVGGLYSFRQLRCLFEEAHKNNKVVENGYFPDIPQEPEPTKFDMIMKNVLMTFRISAEPDKAVAEWISMACLWMEKVWKQ